MRSLHAALLFAFAVFVLSANAALISSAVGLYPFVLALAGLCRHAGAVPACDGDNQVSVVKKIIYIVDAFKWSDSVLCIQ